MRADPGASPSGGGGGTLPIVGDGVRFVEGRAAAFKVKRYTPRTRASRPKRPKHSDGKHASAASGEKADARQAHE
jgi:hypothetical protein